MNNPSFDIEGIENAVFYILRSTCDDDIHKAIKYGFWTSTHKNNVTLNALYKKCSKKNIPIYLFFTVVKSFQFVGVAKMTSEVKFHYVFNYWWEELKWSGVFNLKWIYVKDVHYKDLEHLIQQEIPVTQLRDGSALEFSTGKKMLRIFRDYEWLSDIFEAFAEMDSKEEKLRLKRDCYYEYILQLKNKGYLKAFENEQ